MTTATPPGEPPSDDSKPNTPDTFLPHFGTTLPPGYMPSTYLMNMVLSLGATYEKVLVDAGVPQGIAALEKFKLINTTFTTLALYAEYGHHF